MTGSQFSAGPFVRPNESINSQGFLSDALEFEAKLWVTARLPRNMNGGLLFTHTFGERFTPTFELLGRYAYKDSTGAVLPSALLRQVIGQTIFVEPRGSRQYESRDLMDVHLEWLATTRVALTTDVFNVLGSRAIVSVKTTIDDQSRSDPVSRFGAPRLRVAPRALRIGARLQ
jgi:hypothetical protein